MNYLIAKLRMKGNDCKYRKILATNKMVYPAYTDIVTSSSPYSPDNQVLDDGERYTIGACSDWIFALDIMRGAGQTQKCPERGAMGSRTRFDR